MKQTPQELFKQLSKEFSPKKAKEIINEELGKIVELKPLVQLEPTAKEPFWSKFENFLAEGGSLDPIVNTEEKVNTKEEDDKIKAEAKKVDKTVENVESHNYNYDPSVDNINNVNAQEMLNGIQCEINYNSKLTLDEAKELAVKNLAKDPLHYVKEGQFGVKGLGYSEAKLPMDEMEDEGTAVSYSDTMEAKGKDHDGDGDIDSDDYMAAKDKAIKAAKAKKPKKESIDTKLAEIGKAGDVTKMEAQLEFLSNYISEKSDRVNSISEDENLSELVDKKKMKDMQREIKLLEKRKGKMEKMYEKMCGKKYRKAEMVDEMDAVSYNEKNNPTRNRAVGERDPKKVGKSTSDYAINR